MRKSLILLSILIPLSCSNGALSPDSASDYDFSTVDQFVEENLSVYNQQVVVLVSQNGKLIYSKEAGLKKNNVRLIASASKWLSAAVIMALVDDHKLALDDTVGRFLPIFTEHGKGGITIRQLFSHTSGFAGDSPQRYEYQRSMTLAEAVDSIAIYDPLTYAPGTAFHYGGASMQIGGRIAEIVSGKSWHVLFDEKIAKPCNMSTFYGSVNNPIISGGGRSSAEDYLHFLEMIVNKGVYANTRVLSENSVSQMLVDQTAGAKVMSTPYPSNPYSPFPATVIRYGMGNWLDVVSPSGAVLESSSPGLFGAHPWQDSKNKLAGIIFTQTTPQQSAAISLQIRKMIREIVEAKGAIRKD